MEQLPIGEVTASYNIRKESEETVDFHMFCMHCVMLHRNNHGDIRSGKVVSECNIPPIFCIGYADKIIVATNEDRTETHISFPGDFE